MISFLKQGYFLLLFIAILVISLLTSCGNEPQQASSTRHLGMMDDSLIQYNKQVVKDEDQEIVSLVYRYHWNMSKTATGLRYMIYKNGTGDPAAKNKMVRISYSVRLMNGDLCYSSGPNDPREFKIGHSSVESGLEEGILLMRVGDRAKFIVPSHLAFGLLGDQNKIPQRATLIYDVELLNVK